MYDKQSLNILINSLSASENFSRGIFVTTVSTICLVMGLKYFGDQLLVVVEMLCFDIVIHD